jgi:hypothetical protein
MVEMMFLPVNPDENTSNGASVYGVATGALHPLYLPSSNPPQIDHRLIN